MAFFRIRRHRRGYNELEGNTRFMDRVEFMQGSGLLLKRSVNFYVDGKNGEDTNNGLSMDRPFATIAAAVTAMNARIDWAESPWARGDNLFIAPGKYAENLTTLPYGCNIYGLGDAFDLDGERGVTIKPAAGSPLDATSIINNRIQNICFEGVDASPIFQADNFNRNVLVDCLFTGKPGAITSTMGLEIVKDMTGNIIRRCIFQVVHNGIYIVTDNAHSKQASGNIIEDCYVRGVDLKGIYFHQHCVPSYTQINRCIIGDGGTALALGLDDDSGIVNVSNTMFTATNVDPAHAGGGKYNNCHLNGVLLTNA